MKQWILATLLFVSSAANAAVVAVVDSGVDFAHEELQPLMYQNPNEIPGNLIDDDGNGLVDDVNGWNFIDNYDRVFFREHLTSYDKIVYPLFRVIARRQAGTSRAQDDAYWNNHVMSLSEEKRQELLLHLNSFGQYVHGTHVAGIVAQESPTSKIISSRVFADEPPPFYRHDLKREGWRWTDGLYWVLAQVQNVMFDQVAQYNASIEADVANYSLGVSMQMIARAILALRGNQEPTDEEVSAEASRAIEPFKKRARKWIDGAPNTLFVVAAGNDGTNNDDFPVFPAIIRAPNLITVAATNGHSFLASFSNYGIKSVDIAAPGVAIDSAVPSLDRKTRLPLSGTSMAAPYVSGVAASIKEVNPQLTPSDVKQILMDTVDKKDWLTDKVISGGIVNSARARYAAKQLRSIDVTMDAAIRAAREAIPDHADLIEPAINNESDEFSKALIF